MKSKMSRFILLVIPILILSFKTYSQGLKTGQRCPDVTLRNIIKYDSSEANLSDFKGKLVILDFWALHCTGCSAALREMESLQKLLGKRIQIIMINKESKKVTENFFEKLGTSKTPDLPFVTGYTVLSKLCPHLLVPHH